MNDEMTFPVHPRTGLPAVGIVGGRPVWPIRGGSVDDDPEKGSEQGGDKPELEKDSERDRDAPPAAGKTFTQAELDQHIADRIARERKKVSEKYGDYDELKKKATNFDKLAREQETANEKAVREAREEGIAAGREETRPKLVGAEFRAAANGRIDRARLETLTEDIDFRRYLLEDGTVDLDKIAAKVDAWAPPKQEDPETDARRRAPRPDPSQGPSGKKVSGMSAGRELFAASRGRSRATA